MPSRIFTTSPGRATLAAFWIVAKGADAVPGLASEVPAPPTKKTARAAWADGSWAAAKPTSRLTMRLEASKNAAVANKVTWV